MKKLIVFFGLLLGSLVLRGQTMCPLQLVPMELTECIDSRDDINITFSNVTLGTTISWDGIKEKCDPGEDGFFSCNLERLEKLGAFEVGHVIRIEVTVVSPTCLTGYTGSKDIAIQWAKQVADKKGGDCNVTLVAPAAEDPVITIDPSLLCAGTAGTVTATIQKVTDFTGYTLAVYNGATPVTAGFTIGTLGAATTISADASVAPGTYTVKLTDGSGSTFAATPDLVVKAQPTVSLTAPTAQMQNGKAYYCTVGADKTSVAISGGCSPAGTYTYKWERNGVQLTTTTANHTATDDGTYKLIATDADGCAGEGTMTVDALPAPAKPVITGPANHDVCVDIPGNTKVTVTNHPGNTYEWTGVAGSTNEVTVNNNAVATTTAGTSITVQESDGKCKSNISDPWVLYGHKVSVTLDRTGTQTVPENVPQTVTATTTFTPAGATADVWTWTASGSGVGISGPTNGPSITTNPITGSGDTYKVKLTDNFGCPSNEPSVTFTVDPGSMWSVKASDISGCQGTVLTVVADINGNPAAPTYKWTSVDGLTFVNDATKNVQIPATQAPGVYTATITVTSAGVSKTSTATVTVFEKPVMGPIQVTDPKNCVGEQIGLKADATKGTAPLNYTWTGASGTTNTATATLENGTNNYTVFATDKNGCVSNTETLTQTGHKITVTPSLNGSTSSPVTVPYGSAGALNCTTSPTADTYEWSVVSGTATIDGANNAKTASTTAITDPTGGFKVKVTDEFGCTDEKPINYTVSGGPLNVAVEGIYLCAGSATPTLDATVTGGTTGPITYAWNVITPGLSLSSTTVKAPAVATTTPPGTYQVEVTVTQGAQSKTSAPATVTVGEQPTITDIAITQNGTPVSTVLPQTVVEATGQGTFPNGTKYTWSSTPAGVIATGQGTVSVTSTKLANGTTCFKLAVTNADNKCPVEKQGCVTVAGTEFKVELEPKSVCEGTSLVVPASVTGGKTPYTCTWSCTDPKLVYTPSADGLTVTVGNATPAGSYTLQVNASDANNNTGTASATITVNPMPAFTSVTPASPVKSQVGKTVLLGATATASATLTWTPGGPVVTGSSTGGTGYANIEAGAFTTKGSFTYTVTAKMGDCKVEENVVINVGEQTTQIEITTEDVEVCEGTQNIQLVATATGGCGTLKYRWEVLSGDVLLTTTTAGTTTVRSASVGTHRLRVHVTDDCADDPAPEMTADVNLVIDPTPVVDKITADNITDGSTNVTTVNFGSEVKLTAEVTPASSTVTWASTPNVLTSTAGKSVQTEPMTATTRFTATVESRGCSSTKDITINVRQPETGGLLRLAINRKCPDGGEDMELTMTATGGTSYEFDLENNSGTVHRHYDGAGPWTFMVSLNDQDTYYAKNFKAYMNGVEINPTKVAPDMLECLFYTRPVIDVTGGVHQITCEAEEMTLTATAQLSGTKFTWDDPKVINGKKFRPTESKNYTVTAETDKGCKATSEVSVTLAPKPSIEISANSTTICLGETVTLSAGGNAATYEWNTGKKGTEITETPNIGGVLKYLVKGTEDVNGCSDTASVSVTVNTPPVITAATRNPKNIAIGKGAAIGIRAAGKDLHYEWQRWTGDSWMTMYDDPAGEPSISGAGKDTLRMSNVPQSWAGTQLKCVVSNDCGQVDTTFMLNVKECFDILDVEWSMCEGIRPETNPNVEIDGWYCPGTKIGICAKLILEDPEDVDFGSAVYVWTVDGLHTDDGRWGEMVFISDSSVLSWVPPATWQDNITIALKAYVDGACDTIERSYIRLKASQYTDLDWRMLTSVDPTRRFCPEDTVKCWIDDPKHSAGLHPTYQWYNDIFALSDTVTLPAQGNELLSIHNEDITLRMGQKDTWVKVVMTPSIEICTKDKEYVDTAFLQVKQMVEPKFWIWTEDTLACLNDEIRFEARFENAGLDPKFQWTRSIGEPYWNLGTRDYATTVMDENDVWVKCVLTPSPEVCFRHDTIFAAARQVRIIQNPDVVIFSDNMANSKPGDEITIESDITKMPVRDPHYTWYVNNRIERYENNDVFISSDFAQGDKIQLGVSGERICQNQVMSNILEIDFYGSGRDTSVVIYRGETIRDLNLFRPGDEGMEFMLAMGGYTGNGKVSIGMDGKFNFVPDPDFVGLEKVTYVVFNRFTGNMETGYVYVEVKDKERYFVPNIITPNGDGMNDTWRLEFLADFPNHLVTVYNRYSKVVFQANHYQNDWDGSGQGNSGYVANFNLPNGIYTYVIDLGNKEILKGWLEIRRNMNLGRYSR